MGWWKRDVMTMGWVKRHDDGDMVIDDSRWQEKDDMMVTTYQQRYDRTRIDFLGGLGDPHSVVSTPHSNWGLGDLPLYRHPIHIDLGDWETLRCNAVATSHSNWPGGLGYSLLYRHPTQMTLGWLGSPPLYRHATHIDLGGMGMGDEMTTRSYRRWIWFLRNITDKDLTGVLDIIEQRPHKDSTDHLFFGSCVCLCVCGGGMSRGILQCIWFLFVVCVFVCWSTGRPTSVVSVSFVCIWLWCMRIWLWGYVCIIQIFKYNGMWWLSVSICPSLALNAYGAKKLFSRSVEFWEWWYGKTSFFV